MEDGAADVLAACARAGAAATPIMLDVYNVAIIYFFLENLAFFRASVSAFLLASLRSLEAFWRRFRSSLDNFGLPWR